MTIKDAEQLARELLAKHLGTVCCHPLYEEFEKTVGEGADSVEELSPNERLTLIGTEQSRKTAEERYNALMAGETPLKSHATPLYIKDTADNAEPETGLTEGEKRALNPLVADLLCEFSAAMREREALERQGKRGRGKVGNK